MTSEASSTQPAAAPSATQRGDQDLLFAVAARVRRLSENILRGLDVPLTFRQYRTLARVTAGYTSMSQLAARAKLALPTVSETVDGLVRRKLMQTTPSPVDRRAVLLSVTEAGAAASAAGDVALDGALAKLTENLSSDEKAALDASLRVVYDAATEYFQFPK